MNKSKKKPAPKKRGSVSAKDILKCVKAALPHVCLVMCGMFLVFFFIDRVNNHQGFLTNDFHKWLIFFLSAACAAQSFMMIAQNRKTARLEEKKRLKQLSQRR